MKIIKASPKEGTLAWSNVDICLMKKLGTKTSQREAIKVTNT